MRVIAVYRDLLAIPPGMPAAAFWPAFRQRCYRRHRPVFDAITDTYGAELLGPGGLPAMAARAGPACRAAVERLVTAQPGEAEARCTALIEACWQPAWGGPPDCYLSTLFGLAPAAALTVAGAPAMVIGLERFVPDAGAGPAASAEAGAARSYRLADLPEMIPHEASHVARSRALGLPLAPCRLPLIDLLLFEGTALWFADVRLGRETLRSFLPAAAWEMHRAQEEELLQDVAPALRQQGAAVFARYFSSLAPVNGYYLGWAACRRFLERAGGDAAALTTLPSAAIWQGAGLPLP